MACAPCGTTLLVTPGGDLKRKIGCINLSTRMGRKNKHEGDFRLGMGQGKSGWSVRLCRSKDSGVEFAGKTLQKGEDTVLWEVEIMRLGSGHPGIATLQAVYEDPDSFDLVMESSSGGCLISHPVKESRFSMQLANLVREVCRSTNIVMKWVCSTWI